uniref:Uncharacterized protein n=1 Tax=Helianthus annuus TaxID=4232 RepID=A0A251U850_HELAN
MVFVDGEDWGGVFPVIKEPDYLLTYKLCYYRFGELTTEYGKPQGGVLIITSLFSDH